MGRRRSNATAAENGAASVSEGLDLDPSSLPAEPGSGGALDLTSSEDIDLVGGGGGLELSEFQGATDPGSSGSVNLAPVLKAVDGLTQLVQENHKFHQESRAYICKDFAREVNVGLEPLGKYLARIEQKLDHLLAGGTSTGKSGGGQATSSGGKNRAPAEKSDPAPKNVPEPIKATIVQTLQKSIGNYKGKSFEDFAKALLGNSKFQQMLTEAKSPLTADDIGDILFEAKLIDTEGTVK